MASKESIAGEIAASSIPKEAFKVTAGLFYGLAVISVFARGAIRFVTRRKLVLDDYLLFIAFAFLTAVTGLIYYLLEGIYLSTAIEAKPDLIFQLNGAQVDLILKQSLNENIFLALAWTTTFLVKFSFLAFFRQLIRNVNNIKYYYWGVVALTVVTWMFLTSEAFILCSNFGIAAVKCLSTSRNTLYISMTGLVTGLDALTDMLIVSIPMIVLYRARMQTSQKLSLGVFLCLSLVMVCLAIIRASKIKGASSIDVVWEFYWQYMETVVAVIMGSLTVIRNLHVHHAKSHNNTSASGAGASRSYPMRLLRRKVTQNGSMPQTDVPGASSSARLEPGRKPQGTGVSTLVEEDSFHLLSNERPPKEEGFKPAIHVAVKQAQERSEPVYQGSQRQRPGGWESLQGDTIIQPSVTTICTGKEAKDDDY